MLRRLVDEPDALARVAREALRDLPLRPRHRARTAGGPPGAREDCEAACYDCLMSYGNQPDHRLLDRQAIRGPAAARCAARRGRGRARRR